LARRYMDELRIKASGPTQVVRSLSGGNQQKVVLSKWLAAEPRILILDEPTHGVDVGTKADVHRTISQLAAGGLTILLISSELLEVLGMSDRILVMREGQLVAEIARQDATEERIIQAAAGFQAAAWVNLPRAPRDRPDLRDPGRQFRDHGQLAEHRHRRLDGDRGRGRRNDDR